MTPAIKKAQAERDAAKGELDSRVAELEQTERTHAQLTSELGEAQSAFQAHPTDENADTVVRAKADVDRGELFVSRERARVDAARAVLAKADESLKQLQLAYHESRLTDEHLEFLCSPLAKRYAAALREIADIAAEIDDAVKETVIADVAAVHRLRTGRDIVRAHVFRSRPITDGKVAPAHAAKFPRCLDRVISSELKAQGFHWRLFRDTLHRMSDDLHPPTHTFDVAEAAK